MGTGRGSEPKGSAEKPVSPALAATPGQSSDIPPRQNPYEHALQVGFDTLLALPLSEDRLRSLGASLDSHTICVPALNRKLLVDLATRDVSVEGYGRARRAWAVLCVHYLCAADVSPDTREVAFGHFSDCRSYLDVFRKRIVERFLATTGRTAEQFAELSERLGGKRLPGPGLRYGFDALPRVPIIIVRHDGDDELGPDANVIYRTDVERLLPPEDRVVAAELLLNALAGKTIEEPAGGDR